MGAPGKAVRAGMAAAAIRVDRPLEGHPRRRRDPVDDRTGLDLVERDAAEIRACRRCPSVTDGALEQRDCSWQRRQRGLRRLRRRSGRRRPRRPRRQGRPSGPGHRGQAWLAGCLRASGCPSAWFLLTSKHNGPAAQGVRIEHVFGEDNDVPHACRGPAALRSGAVNPQPPDRTAGGAAGAQAIGRRALLAAALSVGGAALAAGAVTGCRRAASPVAGSAPPAGWGGGCVPDPGVPRQLRGTWIASFKSLDWPSRPGLAPQAQQRELMDLLDLAERLRLNAVLFQVRPTADALYPSSYEPWSKWLTGIQGSLGARLAAAEFAAAAYPLIPNAGDSGSWSGATAAGALAGSPGRRSLACQFVISR